MREQNSQRPGGRGQHRSRGPRRNHRGDDRNNNPVPARTLQKKTLWQQIVGFFTGESQASTSPRPRNDAQRNATSQVRTPRKPEAVEVNSPKLYVGNLSFDAVESDLFELFNGVGEVKNAEIVSNQYTQRSKGFAFVTMQTVDEAKRAVSELNDKDFLGRKLVVSGAKTSEGPSNRQAENRN